MFYSFHPFSNEPPEKFHMQQIFSIRFKKGLYDNSDQRRIRTENQIRTKDKFGPNFEIRPKLFR